LVNAESRDSSFVAGNMKRRPEKGVAKRVTIFVVTQLWRKCLAAVIFTPVPQMTKLDLEVVLVYLSSPEIEIKGCVLSWKNGRHFAVLRSHLLRHIWTAISDNSKWHTKFRGEWILLFSRVLYCSKYLMTIHRFAVSFCTIRLRTIEFKLKWNKLSNIQDISLVDLCIPGFSAEHFKSNLSFVLMDGFSKQ